MTELFQAIHRIGQTDPNKCGDCAHPFHGLPCTIVHCQCPTAFHDKWDLYRAHFADMLRAKIKEAA